MDKENKKKTEVKRKRRFVNSFRFIDDLTALKDDDEFERSFREV